MSGEIWSTFWTLAGRRYCVDWDSQQDAVLHSTLLAESGREGIFTARRELEPVPEEVRERIRARVLKKAAGDAIERAARGEQE